MPGLTTDGLLMLNKQQRLKKWIIIWDILKVLIPVFWHRLTGRGAYWSGIFLTDIWPTFLWGWSEGAFNSLSMLLHKHRMCHLYVFKSDLLYAILLTSILSSNPIMATSNILVSACFKLLCRQVSTALWLKLNRNPLQRRGCCEVSFIFWPVAAAGHVHVKQITSENILNPLWVVRRHRQTHSISSSLDDVSANTYDIFPHRVCVLVINICDA